MDTFMNRLSDESGLAGKILVGVIAWALGAVLMLTSTLVSAQQIDNRVGVITTEVSPIDNDLDSVELAVETNKIAQEILTAAKPLSAQAGQVVDATASIDASAKSINSTAGDIGKAVDGINGSVKSINSNVLSINGTVRAINGTAKDINSLVRSIDGNVVAIAGSVNSINSNLGAVLPVTKTIRGDREGISGFGEGIAGINRRLDAIIAAVGGIKSDTGNVLALVLKIKASAVNIDANTTTPATPQS